MASGGIGSGNHMAGELFKLMAGVNLVHVPYRGEALAYPDLLGGQVQVMFANMLSSIDHIKAGKFRALAVTTAARSEALADIPTVGDFVPGYVSVTWNGVGTMRPSESRARWPRNTRSCRPAERGGGRSGRIEVPSRIGPLQSRSKTSTTPPAAGWPERFRMLNRYSAAPAASCPSPAGSKP